MNRTWNKCGPEWAYHYSSAGLCGLDGLYVRCGVVRCGAGLKHNVAGRVRAPAGQWNAVWCGCGSSLCGAVWVRAWNFSPCRSLVCSHYSESAGLSMVSLVISACIQLLCGRYSESAGLSMVSLVISVCIQYGVAIVSRQDCRWYHWLLVSAYTPHCACRFTLYIDR